MGRFDLFEETRETLEGFEYHKNPLEDIRVIEIDMPPFVPVGIPGGLGVAISNLFRDFSKINRAMKSAELEQPPSTTPETTASHNPRRAFRISI